MKGKKGADFNAGLTIFFILIYFLFFSFIADAVHDFDTSVNNNTTSEDIESSIYNNLELKNIKYCDSPRYRYDILTGQTLEINVANLGNLDCEWSIGAKDQNTCESIEGCNWVNVTKGFSILGWCPSGDCVDYEACTGNINGTYYNINVSLTNNVKDYNYLDYQAEMGINSDYDDIIGYLKLNKTQNVFTGLINKQDNVCMHPKVIANYTLCNMFQCSQPSLIDNKMNIVKASTSVLSMIWNIFTIDYAFNFENDGINTLLYFIFILIPLLLLTITIIYALVG
jgi:hypothetical protein